MTLHLRQPEDAEIGLLLLLLKDLWTGDLTVGSESSVGRGRLQGISATLKRSGKTLGTINATGERLQQLQWSDRLAEQAESYLTALRMKLSKTDQEVAV